jgi:hypothetical protein
MTASTLMVLHIKADWFLDLHAEQHLGWEGWACTMTWYTWYANPFL